VAVNLLETEAGTALNLAVVNQRLAAAIRAVKKALVIAAAVVPLVSHL
jgi:hypothetical protein